MVEPLWTLLQIYYTVAYLPYKGEWNSFYSNLYLNVVSNLHRTIATTQTIFATTSRISIHSYILRWGRWTGTRITPSRTCINNNNKGGGVDDTEALI